ncbi:MAG: hypothetical protein AAF614_38280 [Chloroflexota bacterium]
MDNQFNHRLVVMLILVALLSSCDSKIFTQENDGWDSVTHEAFNFSIEYPDNLYTQLGNEFGYRGRKNTRFIVFTTGAQRPRNLIITVETRSAESPTLNDVINWGNEDLDEIKSDPVMTINRGFEEIFLVEEQINNVTVCRRRYAFRRSSLLYEEVYIARANDMVILTLEVDEDYLDNNLIIFNRMVDSFEPLD